MTKLPGHLDIKCAILGGMLMLPSLRGGSMSLVNLLHPMKAEPPKKYDLAQLGEL